jgi:hypothetical protein
MKARKQDINRLEALHEIFVSNTLACQLTAA